jgi:hypothetical protein
MPLSLVIYLLLVNEFILINNVNDTQISSARQRCGYSTLVQLLCFWALSIVPFLSERTDKNRKMDNAQKHNSCKKYEK